MRDAATGKSRGFAFLTFADANVVDEVASRHHQLDGKNVGKRGFFFFFFGILFLC
jgi:RNA-binding protein Musashi